MTKVKICGLRCPEDVRIVNACLPDYVGFVFAPASRRHISEREAWTLREGLDLRIQAVGVFVNQPVEWAAQLCRSGLIDLVQLHGDEDEAYIQELKSGVPNPVIRAAAVGENPPALFQTAADYRLFDTAGAVRGGSGKSFRWELLRDCRDHPFFLAGGLHAGNVEEAIRQTEPFCVDVSSGVESSMEAASRKDFQKVKELVERVRGTELKRKG